MVRLAGGVVPGPDQGVWLLDPAGLAVHARQQEVPPGTPVVVGSRSAAEETILTALEALDRWVSCAGGIVAGADIDLGEGFRSASTGGGAGDRRDSVLAALSVPGLAERLGERSGVLTALFGPAATKPLGAAAQAAVDDGRWPALRFAVAASDVLGPEQLTELVKLRAPEGVDPFPQGLPSRVGRHLVQVLSTVPSGRRLRLLMDMWDQVCADGLQRQRRERLRASQGRQCRIDDLLKRHAQYEEDELRDRLRAELGVGATFVQIALWKPSTTYRLARATRVMSDVLAATVLARVAATAVDRGVDEAVRAHRAEIDAVVASLSDHEAAASARIIAGLTGLPARPASYLRDIQRRADRRTSTAGPDRKFELSRLAHARDYGHLIMLVAPSLFVQIYNEDQQNVRDSLAAWAQRPMSDWRDRVGFLSPQRLQAWEQPPLRPAGLPQTPSLRQRLQAQPDLPPGQQELIGDLFWYAELADALAQLNGFPAASIQHGHVMPTTDPDLEVNREPFVPATQSIALAAAGAAQLVELGGRVPRRCKSWPELVAGLLATASIAEALTGDFTVSPEIRAADAGVLPGTDMCIEVARNGRQLADWSAYMGNCIARPWYVHAATEGIAALLALRAPDGTIAANVELRPTPHGWRIHEFEARFNQNPDPHLVTRVREWVNSLVRPTPEPTESPRNIRESAVRTRPPAPARLVRDLGESLQQRIVHEASQPETIRAGSTLAGLNAWTSRIAPQHTEVEPALTALRRAGISTLAHAVEQSLRDDGRSGLTDLWTATADRPLQRAIAALPPAGAQRLQPLLADMPLPGSLRPLARLPRIAPARTHQLLALRLRRAMAVLIGQDSSELAQAVNANPDGGWIRAAVLAVTSHGGIPLQPARRPGPAFGAVTAISAPRRVRVPGYPASSLKDDRWQAAMADAVELGATPATFWEHIAAHGLLVPTSWIPHSWPVLWARAGKDD